MQLWRQEFELDAINSGSWYHCLPIRISLIVSGRLYSSCVRSSVTWKCMKKCMGYEVEGARPRGRPKKTWREIVEKD